MPVKLPLLVATWPFVRESRAVVGKSSGGFGALRLGLERPDKFSAYGSPHLFSIVNAGKLSLAKYNILLILQLWKLEPKIK